MPSIAAVEETRSVEVFSLDVVHPDSPAWGRVTRKFGGHTGATGGAMPMLGARMLWKLNSLGLAYQDGRRWRARLGKKVTT